MSSIDLQHQVEFTAMRAQGPGGQNVNKVSTAVLLRFDIHQSSLPPEVQERLLLIARTRINKQGILLIKAQSSRSQEENKAIALQRLAELVASATQIPLLRKPTRPTRASEQRRLKAKGARSEVKATRSKMIDPQHD